MKKHILFQFTFVLLSVLTFAGSAIGQCDCAQTSVTGIPQIECEALVALYDSTDGENWRNSTNWKTNSHCGSWFGITVSGGSVVKINLQLDHLSGSIPTELGNLSNLVELNFFDNQLSGPIPTELGNLTNLEYLSVEFNQISGPIPPELGGLSNLTWLALNANDFSGPIPPELGGLSNLTVLALGDNRLSGPIPPGLANLSSLTVLFLGNCMLSGPIPPELGMLTDLTELYLYGNQLSGNIPEQMGNLVNLEILDFSANKLEGEIPVSLTNLGRLGVSPSINWPTDLFSWNMLTASDPSVLAFLNARNPNWDETQTIPPGNLRVSYVSASSVRLSWTPIPYTADGGHYVVYQADSPRGPYTEAGMTNDKRASEYTVTGLSPSTKYYFAVGTHTSSHDNIHVMGYQQNALTSDRGEEVSAATLTQNGEGAIAIVNVQGRCGEPVMIPVRLQNAPNAVSALGFDVVFDPQIFTYQGFERGPLVPEGYEFDANFIPPNIVRCGSHRNGSLTAIPQGASGDIVWLKFNVAENCQPSQIELENLKDDIAGWASSPGFFTKGTELCHGDVNGDGQITPADSLAAFEKYMFICPTSAGMDCNTVCCDVNTDGNCTPADALCIFNAYLRRPNCLDQPPWDCGAESCFE